MIFDPMPTVHVYPHDLRNRTEHETDDEHECWCEPRIAIVPPGHQFSKENNTTRVFYHSQYARKSDAELNMPTKELMMQGRIKQALRGIEEPPPGGWDTVELAEGVNRLVTDVLTNGWKEPEPPKPPVQSTALMKLGELQSIHDFFMRHGFNPDFIIDPRSRIAGRPGDFHCMDCHKRVEDCKCDEDDDDDDLLHGLT